LTYRKYRGGPASRISREGRVRPRGESITNIGCLGKKIETAGGAKRRREIEASMNGRGKNGPDTVYQGGLLRVTSGIREKEYDISCFPGGGE